MAWDSKDTALTLQGVGSLANAWGQYKTNKKRNKLLEQQFNYAKEQDALALAKQNKAQSNLDSAFSYSDLNPNKKKKKNSIDV
jgi:hypothetical protein